MNSYTNRRDFHYGDILLTYCVIALYNSVSDHISFAGALSDTCFLPQTYLRQITSNIHIPCPIDYYAL